VLDIFFTRLKVNHVKRLQEKTEVNNKIWKVEKSLREHRNQIKREKKNLKQKSPKKFSCSKLLLLFLFINFTILEIFVGWVTVHSFTLAFTYGIAPDFTPLITLIGAVIGETFSYGIYSAKSKAENTQNGIIYELAMLEKQHELNNNDNEATKEEQL